MLTTSADYKTAIAAPGRTFDFTVEVNGFNMVYEQDDTEVTVSGNGIEVFNFVVDMPPVRSGSGTPSASNPRPFVEYTNGVNAYITHNGTTTNYNTSYLGSMFPAGIQDFYGGYYDWGTGLATKTWYIETVSYSGAAPQNPVVTTENGLTRCQWMFSRKATGNKWTEDTPFIAGVYSNLFFTLAENSMLHPTPVAGCIRYATDSLGNSLVYFYFNPSDVPADITAVIDWFDNHSTTVCFKALSPYRIQVGTDNWVNLNVADGTNTFGSTTGSVALTAGTAESIPVSKIFDIQITEQGFESQEGLIPGNFMRNQCSIKVAKDLQGMWTNHNFTVKMSVDGAADVISLGKFWAYEVKEEAEDSVTVTAYSTPPAMETEFELTDEFSAQSNVASIVAWIEEFGRIHLTNKNLLTLGHIDSVPEGSTYRDVLGYIAGYDGYCIRSDRTGNVELYRCSKSYGDYVIVGNRDVTDTWGKPQIFERGLKKEEVPVSVNSITYTNGTSVWTIGVGQGIQYTNPYMTKAQAEKTTYYLDFAYTEAGINWRCDPSLQIGDMVGIKVDAQTTISVPVMRQTFSIDGGLKGTLNSYAFKTEDSSVIVSPTDKKIKSVTQVLESKIDTLEEQMNTISDRSSSVTTTSYCSNVYLWQYGRMMFMKLNLLGTTPATSWTTIATVPTAYRPAMDIAMAAQHYNTNNTSKLVWVLLRSDGQVRAYLSSALTSTSGIVVCTATWLK